MARVAAVALAAIACALAVDRIVRSPAGRVILPSPAAPWIMADTPVTGDLQQRGKKRAPVTRFSASFPVRDPGKPAHLEVRAFGRFSVYLNGRPLALAGPSSWKRFTRAEVSTRLRPGANTLLVEVRNLYGPALLSLRLEGEGVSLRTGSDWMAQIHPDSARPAAPASDVRPHPDAFQGEAPLASLVERWLPLSLLFGLSALGFALGRPRVGRLGAAADPRVLLGMLAAAWLALFVLAFRAIPIGLGFDAPYHLDYLVFLYTKKRLPLMSDGWAMYHPPLFYLLSWMVVGIGDVTRTAGTTVAVKLVPFLSGFGTVCVSAALARRLTPDDRPTILLAIAFAGLLPMNLYTAAYYSNEPLHAFLAGCSLVVATDLLLREEVDPRRAALLSVLLGLALLTKFTALVVAGVVGTVVALRIGILYAGQPRETALRLAALAGPALGIAGWYYARNAFEFGNPIVVNWAGWGADEPGLIYWSQPGFHTLAYYTSFGESLVRPYLSTFVSFWDGVYSTLWGDGQVAGRNGLQGRADWNYEFMSAGYLLALPATAALLAGGVRVLRGALGDADAGRRAALGCLVACVGALGFALFYTTLLQPLYGQSKAFYVLGATPVLAFFFASGVRAADRWLAERGWHAARALGAGWLGALLGCFFLSFAA